jgi:hypothetical protein
LSKIYDEPEPHQHTASCRKLVLTCRLTEHAHSSGCRTGDRLTCGAREHGHGAACFTTAYRCGF